MEHRIRLALIIKLATRLDLKAHVVVEATSLWVLLVDRDRGDVEVLDAILQFNQETGKAYFTNLSTWAKSIFCALGPTWIRLLSPNLYKMEHFNIVHG